MRTWAIGDIQGCFTVFQSLLTKIDFKAGRDQLWLAGDVINRGPESLEMLRWVVRHQADVRMVLGNHELHVLAQARGFDKVKRRDTFQPILVAPDRDALLSWLQRRPLLVRRGEMTMVHAGLAPSWSVDSAAQLAAEIEATLRGPGADALLSRLRGDVPTWTPSLRGIERQVAAVAVLTRMRTCAADGAVTDYVGPPESCPSGQQPWHAWTRRPGTVIFGHWAAYGYHVRPGHVSLDSGAVWGRQLTAWCLEDGTTAQVPGV